MNNNGNGNNEPPKIPIVCHCGQRFSAKLPTPEILNAAQVSIVTAAHQEPIKCLCGQLFVLGITEAQVGWAAQPLRIPEKPRIIVPQLRPV